MNVKILVATHKKYWMPQDDVYLPIHVGREGRQDLGFIGDNTGDNISLKNPNYCELTGIYWAWKNLECDYIGLCHYRRYFCRGRHNSSIQSKYRDILNKADYEKMLQKCDVILPQKRNYYIETVRSQYEHGHYKQDLDEVEKIINEICPSYVSSFKEVMDSRKLYILNMFVMKKQLFDEYCLWLFTILFELENRINISSYNEYQSRIYGFLSERLFNVWLHKKQLHIITVPVVNLEQVDWVKKIFNFLKRKYLNKK